MRFAKPLLFCAAFSIFLSVFAATTKAQSVTFAQFLERAASQDFIFTNNTSNATFDTVGSGSSVFFQYSNIVGLDSSLDQLQLAHLFVTTMATTPATLSVNNLNQSLNQTTVITILRDTPAPVGSGTRRNLLTATISTNTAVPALTGTNTGNSGTFSVTTPDHIVTFTSDFLTFSVTTQRNLALSFSSIQPTLALGSGNFLQSFTAASTGTFASDPVPTPLMPTAASVSVSGRVLTPSGRGLSRARVNLTENDGTLHTVITNPFGYYSFSDLPAGQTAFLTVDSKSYSYAPQVIMLTEDISNLFFTSGESVFTVRNRN